MSQQEQSQKGISTDLFWAFMDFSEGKRKNRQVPKKRFLNQKLKKRYRPKFRVLSVSDVWLVIPKYLMKLVVATVKHVGPTDEYSE